MTAFAFYGRVSTEDQQDPNSSRNWQLSRARALIEPSGGEVVAEYFDVGHSRALPWKRRPQASALLAALKDPDRGFEAVVIGEPARAFYGNQFGLTFPVFSHYGVELWVPEVGGRIDPESDAHDLVMSMYGGMSKGERNRIKTRVRSAMSTQAQLEGRYLGGRPPYGYRLVDAGPHPNPGKAADGKRLRRLEPDPETALIVQRIFTEYLIGRGLYAIAEGLTSDHVPSPSANDPDRNRHRNGIAWAKGAVRSILINPRYTGRQVWNKQRKDEVLVDVDDVALGHQTKLRWNGTDEWQWSHQVVHEPLVDTETFQRVQDLLGGRGTGPCAHKPHRGTRPYVLRGLVYCGVCERRMQGNWANDQPYYRCRFPQEYALANKIDHPRNVLLRERVVVPSLDSWLATAFAPHRLTQTVRDLEAAQDDGSADAGGAAQARHDIAECDHKLAQHRAALEAGADPALVTSWIRETQAHKAAAEARLDDASQSRLSMSEQQIAGLIDALGDILGVLRDADPQDKAEIYRQFGLRLTYRPADQTVRVEAHLNPDNIGKWFVSGGRLGHNAYTSPLRNELEL